MRMKRQEVLGRAPAAAQSPAAMRTPHDGASGANSLDAIRREPRAERAESREPRAESREPRAESREPRAESREPRAESREPRAESREPRAESREPRAESREPRAESREPRAESREPRAESREPRAESREPRAESREPRVYQPPRRPTPRLSRCRSPRPPEFPPPLAGDPPCADESRAAHLPAASGEPFAGRPPRAPASHARVRGPNRATGLQQTSTGLRAIPTRLARISHQLTAADAGLTELAALNTARVLDVPAGTCRATQSLLRLQAGQAIHGLPARQKRNAGGISFAWDEVPPALGLSPARPARPDSRSPCQFSHLRALASRPGEKCGLGVLLAISTAVASRDGRLAMPFPRHGRRTGARRPSAVCTHGGSFEMQPRGPLDTDVDARRNGTARMRAEPGRPGRVRARSLAARGLAAVLLATFAALLALPLQAQAQTLVPDDWSLKPAGHGIGDQFRLLFLSSTTRDGSSTDIAPTTPSFRTPPRPDTPTSRPTNRTSR